jgi:hypothetical protein
MEWLWLPALAAAAAMFGWYAICWMALPHHHGDFRSLGRAGPLDAALLSAKPAPGMYMFPHYRDYQGMKDPALAERMKSGPNAWLVVMKGCGMGPAAFLRGFVLNFLQCAALACLLHASRGVVSGLFPEVQFSAAVGLFAVGGSFSALAVWMGLPWRYVVTSSFDAIVGYGLAGLVMHFVR